MNDGALPVHRGVVKKHGIFGRMSHSLDQAISVYSRVSCISGKCGDQFMHWKEAGMQLITCIYDNGQSVKCAVERRWQHGWLQMGGCGQRWSQEQAGC